MQLQHTRRDWVTVADLRDLVIVPIVAPDGLIDDTVAHYVNGEITVPRKD